jgi:hypothetical protein
MAIVDGEDPELVVGGPKVRAFWRAIVDPQDPYNVVVDRHAASIALGHVITRQDVWSGNLNRRGRYEHVARMYRTAAKIISGELGETWTPSDVQATTWIYWRRTAGRYAGME